MTSEPLPAGDQPAGPLAGVDAPATNRDGDAVTNDDQARKQPDPAMVLVTVDEAKTVLWELGGAIAERAGVAELLRQIILAGRDTRVLLLDDEARRPMAQHATLEGFLADPGAQRAARVVKVLGRWRDVADRADSGHYVAQLFGEVAEAVAERPAEAEADDPRYQHILDAVQLAGARGVTGAELAGDGEARPAIYALLRRAKEAGLVVQPHPRGRYYWRDCAPAGDAGRNRPVGELLDEIMTAEGVDEREAAHRLLERAGHPRTAPAGDDRAHAGLGLPCDVCPGPCTIDGPVAEGER
jgi:hypothetical protein